MTATLFLKENNAERKRRELPLSEDMDTNLTENPVVVRQGKEEGVKDFVKKDTIDKTKIENLVKKSTRIIADASSVFPFELFPTKIIVEETKITIIFHFFFAISQTHTLDVKDITNIFVGRGPFFASLEIVSRTFIQNNIQIKKMWKEDAMKIRNIIEGLRTFQREGINTASFEKDELVQKLMLLAQNEPAF